MIVSFAELNAVVAEVLAPARFFVGAGAELHWQGPVREAPAWEIFRGLLLDQTQTRQRRSLVAWNVFWLDKAGQSTEPLLSVKLDAEAGELHVVRALHRYVWEAADSARVVEGGHTTRWVRELVGSIGLAGIADLQALHEELVGLLTTAVVGASRLPLTSAESPLPAFSLGRLTYRREPLTVGPARSWRDLAAVPDRDQSRWLEAIVRALAPAEVEDAARVVAGAPVSDLRGLLRELFNQTALSPWTGFVDSSLGFVLALVRQGSFTPADEIDWLGWLLRQLGRHLTAYDLVTFHHRGANYPDALLLDSVLKRYLALAEQVPALFLADQDGPAGGEAATRLRRRALRQGWLLRRLYENHLVPDAPASPGESARVLPAPHLRVPEEQILQPARRRRLLFADDPLDRSLGPTAEVVLRQSVLDLAHPQELRELGMAVFIDRPLGVFKHSLEPDRTPLFSHLAFSRQIARCRLDLLQTAGARAAAVPSLDELAVPGLPLSAVQCEPGRIVSLADAQRAAEDFLLVRTSGRTVRDFLAQYDFASLAGRPGVEFLMSAGPVLIVPDPVDLGAQERVLAVYDAELHRRLELAFGRDQGYELCAGREGPRGGLEIRLGGGAAGRAAPKRWPPPPRQAR